MSAFVWTSNMSVGVSELDTDHKGLMEIIRGLEEQTGAAAVQQSIVALMRYTQVHFAREQAVMRRCGFPGMDHHIGEHQDFIKRLRRVIAEFKRDPELTAEYVRGDLLEFLKTWWRHHVMIEDKAYRPFAEAAPADAARAAGEVKGSHIWWD